MGGGDGYTRGAITNGPVRRCMFAVGIMHMTEVNEMQVGNAKRDKKRMSTEYQVG